MDKDKRIAELEDELFNAKRIARQNYEEYEKLLAEVEKLKEGEK